MIYCIDSITDQWVLNRNWMNTDLERFGRPAGMDAGSICLFQCVLVRTAFLLDHLLADPSRQRTFTQQCASNRRPFPCGRKACPPPAIPAPVFLRCCPGISEHVRIPGLTRAPLPEDTSQPPGLVTGRAQRAWST